MNSYLASGTLGSRVDVKVDGQTSESWAGVLDQFADASIYQTLAYGTVRWGERNLSHLVMHHDGRTVAAAQVRVIRMPLLPTGVAYVRWGPMCHRKDDNTDPAIVGKMLECLREEYCKRRGLFLQVIPNVYPESERGTGFLDGAGSSGFGADLNLPSYRTILVDLASPAEVIRKRQDRKWRTDLNGSEKNGLELEVTCSRQGYGEFERLYQTMWDRKRFETSMDVREFGRIQEELAARDKMRIFLARKDGEAVGAVVCSLMGDTAIYLLGATNDRARELKASYFLHWQTMMWLKNRGARWYDLGGIDPQANPGGYKFKSRFGGNEMLQIPTLSTSDSILGDALNRGITWLRRRRVRTR